MRDNKAGLEGQFLMELNDSVSSVSEGTGTDDCLTVAFEEEILEN